MGVLLIFTDKGRFKDKYFPSKYIMVYMAITVIIVYGLGQ